MDNRAFGRLGENAASLWLEKQGCTVLQHNLYIGHSEVDLLLADGEYLVFAEVKTRRAHPDHPDAFGSPSSAVDAKKSAFLIRAAEDYMASHPDETRIPRIDVIEVYADPLAGEFRVTDVVWMKNAVVKNAKFGRKNMKTY
ncbi:MAG: YraN family protein [Clostridia bacterium]|nr:YraN family protein [Clostridia bacterium]MBQ8368859.1 YraN family protein [Clostridia bacterium]